MALSDDPANDDPSSRPVFVLTASLPRRVFGTAMLVGLGLILLNLAATHPGVLWRIMLAVPGLAAFWLARGLWLSTAGHVALTDAGLVDHRGHVLAALDEIADIDRSTFAFKPSNGVLVKLKHKAKPAWAPGMWWRHGKRLGIGGVTASADGRLLADLLKASLTEQG